MPKYTSDIIVGDKYRDEQTGITGHAIGVHFYQHGCERVSIETVVEGAIKEYGFDAPRLTHVPTEKPVRARGTGGPDRHTPTRGTGR